MSSTASTSSQPVTPHSSPRTVAVVADDWNQPFDGCHLPLDLLSSLDTLVESEFVSKTSSQLNPYAAEFQPTAALPSKPLSASNDPPWTLSFVKGTWRHPADRIHLARDASYLISSPSFSLSRDIKALADKFCDRAALLKFQGGPETITPFAAEVIDTMQRLLGVEAAEEFRRCLVDVVALTFTNVWEIEVPKAGSRMPLAIAGVSLGAFMAQLHEANLLEGALITQAIASMFRTCAVSMEHLQVMHIIVTGVGARYWSMPRATREEYLGFFERWILDVKEDVRYPSSAKMRWVEEIRARVGGS